ncbi:MAG: PQQ-dependent sugar dehydrogenase [Ignavibacteria bacterium]|nr:PQQ-dependent sugar dehydrogenase [Ignavibacteria bacterium]
MLAILLIVFEFRGEKFFAQGSYTIQPVEVGLNIPVRFAFAPDSTGRTFYLELQTGNVKVIKGTVAQNGTWLHVDVATQGERGLLGIAFDPDFSNNRYVYVYYTAPFTTPRNRVERYTEVNFRADTSSRLLLYEQSVATPCGVYTNHNSGALVFGTDRKLYISVGENFCSQLAEDLSDPRGKILRIEPNVPSPNNAVTTNPFYDDGDPTTGYDDRIFAFGLRNSFGMTLNSFDSTIYATENGPDCNDEVNRILVGDDYGWRPECQTGPTHCSCAQDSPYKPPLWQITPTIAPTGIVVYHGTFYPELDGKILFVDYNFGSLRAGTLTPAKDSLNVTIISQPGLGSLFDIVEGTDGYIYFSYASGISRLNPLSTGVANGNSPSTFFLRQNYPNPFNNSTVIEYEIPQESYVRIAVYDGIGKLITTLVDQHQPAGVYRIQFDAKSLSSGVYFYTIKAGSFTDTKQLQLIK